MKNSILWDITPSSPLKVNRRFGGTHRLQGKIRWQAELTCHLRSRQFFARLIF
jgi:hypothetical protein